MAKCKTNCFNCFNMEHSFRKRSHSRHNTLLLALGPRNVIHPIERLTAGSCVTIEGKISLTCSSFYVNFRCGNDVLLHINPRFDQNYIARNVKINKIWGQEESQLQQRMPLARGDNLVMEILVAPSEYMVSVNGVHIFNFSHRVAYSDVKAVEITNGLAVRKCVVNQVTTFPQVPATPATLPLKCATKCPFMAKIGSMQAGDLIELTARVHSLPHSFFLNLQTGPQAVPHPIIAYHISVRYLTSWQVIQNTWSGGKWNEEITEKLPSFLLPGETFRLVISVVANCFLCNVNGKVLRNLPIRVPPSTVNTLLIVGDVTILSIKSSMDNPELLSPQRNELRT